MLQIQTIENLAGFGDKNAPGEYYHSENLIPGQFGLEANISIIDDPVTGATAPVRFNWFAEKTQAGSPGMYAVDTAGNIFFRNNGTWELSLNPTVASSGNGLLSANEGRVYYTSDRYLGVLGGSETLQDLGVVSTALKPMEQYEDWVVIGHEKRIAIFNIIDLSFNDEALLLPGGFIVRAIKSNQTGLLVGSNYQNQGVLFLWDVRSLRSISEWIWLDHPIQSICKYGSRWIVTTTKEQFITDGYSIAKLPSLPDVSQQMSMFSCLPAGTLVIGDKLFTANTAAASYNRLKSGLYTQDLTTGLFSFVSVGNGCKTDMTMGALHQDSNLNHFISYTTNLPSSHHVALFNNASPTIATLISPRLGKGANKKVAEGVQVDISAVPKVFSLNSAGSFDVSLKIYNFKRQLWGYGLTNGISADEDELRVNGTLSGYNNARIGDEVTVLSGANAGQVRHITDITGQNTSSEVWTLNSELPNLTENAVYLNVQPFQLVKTKTVSISDLSELESVYFDVRNRIKGKKFLAKVVISNISTISLSIPSLAFIYDDLGIL
jgi:hypothetical protein